MHSEKHVSKAPTNDEHGKLKAEAANRKHTKRKGKNLKRKYRSQISTS